MSSRAIITGSSSGIGFAYAKYLSREKWNLDLVSNDKVRLTQSESALGYKNVKFHQADLSNDESVKHIINSFETPNLLIANAGIAINGAVGRLNQDDKKKASYLMFGGVIDLIEGFVPKMIKNGGGRIVIISSFGALAPMPKSAVYSGIKSGIYAYGKSISAELKDKNISVTVSLPGYVRTNAHTRSGLDHLEKKVPRWMWISADQVVRETEKASRSGKNEIIPGRVYKLTKPFLKYQSAITIWRSITKRN
tara:strand:- start:109 stop:861 length:753 start_codon:yes stop_codon:yes gene_type:complete